MSTDSGTLNMYFQKKKEAKILQPEGDTIKLYQVTTNIFYIILNRSS